jgi:tRNA A37 threonylcarbamoyltransferase TsaD
MRILLYILIGLIAVATIPGVVFVALILFIFARALSMGWNR